MKEGPPGLTGAAFLLAMIFVHASRRSACACPTACPQTCARMALCKHRDIGVPGLEDTVRELMAHRDVMLPSVRQAIEEFLLAELSRN